VSRSIESKKSAPSVKKFSLKRKRAIFADKEEKTQIKRRKVTIIDDSREKKEKKETKKEKKETKKEKKKDSTINKSNIPLHIRTLVERNVGAASPKRVRFEVFVGNLSDHTSEQDLEDAFSRFGTITSLRKPLTHASSFAFVQYATIDGALNAVKANEKMICGRKVMVQWAKKREWDKDKEQRHRSPDRRSRRDRRDIRTRDRRSRERDRRSRDRERRSSRRSHDRDRDRERKRERRDSEDSRRDRDRRRDRKETERQKPSKTSKEKERKEQKRKDDSSRKKDSPKKREPRRITTSKLKKDKQKQDRKSEKPKKHSVSEKRRMEEPSSDSDEDLERFVPAEFGESEFDSDFDDIFQPNKTRKIPQITDAQRIARAARLKAWKQSQQDAIVKEQKLRIQTKSPMAYGTPTPGKTPNLKTPGKTPSAAEVAAILDDVDFDHFSSEEMDLGGSSDEEGAPRPKRDETEITFGANDHFEETSHRLSVPNVGYQPDASGWQQVTQEQGHQVSHQPRPPTSIATSQTQSSQPFAAQPIESPQDDAQSTNTGAMPIISSMPEKKPAEPVPPNAYTNQHYFQQQQQPPPYGRDSRQYNDPNQFYKNHNEGSFQPNYGPPMQSHYNNDAYQDDYNNYQNHYDRPHQYDSNYKIDQQYDDNYNQSYSEYPQDQNANYPQERPDSLDVNSNYQQDQRSDADYAPKDQPKVNYQASEEDYQPMPQRYDTQPVQQDEEEDWEGPPGAPSDPPVASKQTEYQPPAAYPKKEEYIQAEKYYTPNDVVQPDTAQRIEQAEPEKQAKVLEKVYAEELWTKEHEDDFKFNLTIGNRSWFKVRFEIWGSVTPIDPRRGAGVKQFTRIPDELYRHLKITNPKTRIQMLIADTLKCHTQLKRTTSQLILTKATAKVEKGWATFLEKRPNGKIDSFLNSSAVAKIRDLVSKYVERHT